MWPMAVVMIDVLGENCFELTPVEDQDPVEALPTDGAHETLGKGVGPRGLGWRADDPDSLDRKTASKPAVNLASRSRTRNLTAHPRSASTIVRLRACWVTQGPAGLAVIPLT
jgi:hypothetical protein